MGGGKGQTKYQVAEYYLTLDYGLCHGPLDSINEIWVKEKKVWDGTITQNTTLTMNNLDAFGGKKKEGGVYGRVDFYLGTAAQIMTGPSANRYGLTPTEMPGYRGIAHLLFRGPEEGEITTTNQTNGISGSLFGGIFDALTPAQSTQKGFLWIMNNPYLPPTWINATRIPKGWMENLSAIPRGEIGDRSLYFLLDRSASLSGAQFSTIKNSVLDSLDFIELAMELGNRIDIGVRFWSSGVGDVWIERTNVTATDLDDIRSFIASTGQLTGGNVVPAYTAAEAWFQATKNEDFAGRSLILVTDAASNDGFGTAASGPAADMLNQSSGEFSTANGNPVDLYAINYNQPTTTYTTLLDNTPVDGIPVINSSDTQGLSNAVRRAILSGLVLDANPSHMIRECLTNEDWGLGVPEADIGTSFEYAAQVLISEGFGLTMQWTQQSAVEKFVQEVCDHIQGMVYLDPETGLWEIKLIRGDYDLDTAISLDPSNCSANNRQRKAMSETTNEIVITFTNPKMNDDQSITFQDIANVAMQGGIRSETRNYYGVRYSRLAQAIGARDLRSASYPTFSTDLTVDTTVGKIKPGQVVKFTWPDDGIVDMPLRVYKIDYGKPGDSKMKLTVTEDIFGLGQTVYEPVDDTAWQDTTPVPQPLEYISITTPPLPLLLRSGVSLSDVEDGDYPAVIMAVAGNSENQPVDSIVLSGDVTKPNGDVVVETLSEVPSTPLGFLEVALVAQASSTMTGAKVRKITGLDADPEAGDCLQIGLDDYTCEIVMLYAYNSGTDVYTLARGLFDTTPKAWPIGSPIWFLDDSLRQLEQSEHASGTPSYYKVQTSNGGGVLSVGHATTENFTPTDRPYAPHRPANVTFNGVAFPVGVLDAESTGQVILTWAHRDRLAEDVVTPLWTDPNITPEVGQVVDVVLRDSVSGVEVNRVAGLTGTTYTVTTGDFSGRSRLRIEVVAVRDFLQSIQNHSAEVKIADGYGWSYGFNYGGS